MGSEFVKRSIFLPRIVLCSNAYMKWGSFKFHCTMLMLSSFISSPSCIHYLQPVAFKFAPRGATCESEGFQTELKLSMFENFLTLGRRVSHLVVLLTILFFFYNVSAGPALTRCSRKANAGESLAFVFLPLVSSASPSRSLSPRQLLYH